MGPYVRLCDLDTLCKKSERLSFSGDQGYYALSLMSIKFSGDTKEIVGGTKGADVLVYDMMTNKVTTRVTGAHNDEINSVCFANRMQSDIVFTGSDDCLIKIWDRRALGPHS
jgi:WD repeat-containing protein 23